MRICVTGASGFIGSELIKCLNDNNYFDIIAIDYESKPLKEGLIVERFIDWEFIFKNKYYDFLNLVDFSYHIGGNSSTRATREECEYQNIMFSIDFIKENSIRDIPLVFSSSASVYGAWRIDDFIAPQSEYAKSKAVIEDFISIKPAHLNVALRYHNVYGATESHKGNMASIVSKWVDNYNNGILQNDLFYGSENIKRDFIHINDVNRVHLLLLKCYIKNGFLPNKMIIDVGSGVAVSFEQLANQIIKHTKGQIRYIDNPFDESNYQFYTKANIEYLSSFYNNMFGEIYNPKQIEEGIRLVFNKKTNNE